MKFAIFDLDGTLADTLEDLGDACNGALSKNGYPIHEPERYRTLVGRGVRNLVTNALPMEAREESIIDTVLADFRALYKEGYLRKTVLYPGISEMLKRMRTEGCRCAVLTNKPHEYAVEILRELGAAPYLEEVFGQQEGVPRKPNPAAVMGMLKRCGIPSGEGNAFVGDSDVDMQTAVNAGMVAIGVSWGFRSEAELWENGCDFMAHTAQELAEILLREPVVRRVGTPEQRMELCQMAKGIWEEHYTPIIGADQVAYMLANFQSPEVLEKQMQDGYRYFYLTHNGEIAGYMGIQPQKDVCFLSKLYLKKEYRGKGIARRAIEDIAAMDSKWKKIRLTVNKHNDGSIAAYQKLGFATADSVVTDIGGGYVMDDYVMEKELGR